MAERETATATATANEAPPPTSIVDEPIWRYAVLLGGVGDGVVTLLPLFVIGALGRSAAEGAGVVAAYTLGALFGHVGIWGRLADRTTSPRGLVIAGTAAQGALMLALAFLPRGFDGLFAFAMAFGFVAVSMDSALMRLAAGNLPARRRSLAVLRYARLLEGGALIGMALLAVLLLGGALLFDAETALRASVVVLALAVLLQSQLIVSAGPVAGDLPGTAAQLATDGFHVLRAGVAGPLYAVARVVLTRPSPLRPKRSRLPDALLLMLLSLAVVHMGFAVYNGILAVYFRQEGGLPDGAIMVVFIGVSILSTYAMGRVGIWLTTIPAVTVQMASAVLRVFTFGLLALLAFVPGEWWSVTFAIVVVLVASVSWGGVTAASAARVTDLAPSDRRAEVMALYNAAIGAGTVAGGALGAGLIAGIGFAPAFAAAAAIVGVAVVLLHRW